MNHLLSIVLACVISFLCIYENINKQVIGDNKVIVNENSFDFGKIRIKNLPATHEFILQNFTDSDMKLVQVCTTCPCLSVSWKRETIRVHGSSTITLKLNGNLELGHFSKSAIVYASNIKHPIKLTITGILTE